MFSADPHLKTPPVRSDALSIGSLLMPPAPQEAPAAARPESLATLTHAHEPEAKSAKGSGRKEDSTEKPEAQDVNVIVVGWDGPDDPANPRK